MIKLKIFLALFFLTAMSPISFAQSPDCTKFREGRFRIADSKAGIITIADRNSMYQTETCEALKAVVRFKISWQDNCTYTLKLEKVIRNENKINFPANLEIKVKITATSAIGYTQEITSSLNNSTYLVDVTRLN